MLNRAILVSLTVFWLAMNVLLWRAEYGGRGAASGPVPVSFVWRKILTAPDSSSLKVFYHGENVGFCHWTTSVGEDLSRLKEEDLPPEGMVARVSGYRIQVEGNVAMKDFRNRARFDCQFKMTTNQVWQEFSFRLNMRPSVWEVHCLASEQKLRLKVADDDGSFERVFRFSELQNPELLVQEVAGPSASEVLGGLGLMGLWPKGGLTASALKWEARNDVVNIGPAPVRAYRLQVRLVDRFQAVFYVSRVGEILRVELPDGLVLANDQLANL
jgi:hypothetical protein